MNQLFEVFFILIILLFFSIISYKKKSLDREGILIANIIGITTYLLGGLTSFLLIALFFVVAETCTRFARKKHKIGHEKRTTGNILGNSGAAIIALWFASLNPALEIAFFGAIAAALADTLSSEIGLLSKKKPRLITNWQEVEPGTDGGVTLLGFGAALAGAAIIASIHFYLNQNLFAAAILIVAGFIGSVVDSFFGALFERTGVLKNWEVNFLGSASGAVAARYLFL